MIKASSQQTCSLQRQATVLVPTYGTMARTVAGTTESSAKAMGVAEVEPSQSKLWIAAPTAAVEAEPSTFPPKLLLPLPILTLVSSLSVIPLLHPMTMLQCPGKRSSSLLKSSMVDNKLAGAEVRVFKDENHSDRSHYCFSHLSIACKHVFLQLFFRS
jgi:hypothetical protein